MQDKFKELTEQMAKYGPLMTRVSRLQQECDEEMWKVISLKSEVSHNQGEIGPLDTYNYVVPDRETRRH